MTNQPHQQQDSVRCERRRQKVHQRTSVRAHQQTAADGSIRSLQCDVAASYPTRTLLGTSEATAAPHLQTPETDILQLTGQTAETGWHQSDNWSSQHNNTKCYSNMTAIKTQHGVVSEYPTYLKFQTHKNLKLSDTPISWAVISTQIARAYWS